ncbi:MAG: type II toxin-antitoxin system VapB family antitoxin [Xanthomonadales bacterium]|nr:type II toxin-antitoxin system VapB family antitoxin [Xanthomonadales bacterium]
MSRTRTNIRLPDDKIAIIMQRYGLKTKSEAVEMALNHLVGVPMTREEALAMRGRHAIESVPEDTCPPGDTDTG